MGLLLRHCINLSDTECSRTTMEYRWRSARRVQELHTEQQAARVDSHPRAGEKKWLFWWSATQSMTCSHSSMGREGIICTKGRAVRRVREVVGAVSRRCAMVEVFNIIADMTEIAGKEEKLLRVEDNYAVHK